MNASAWNNGGNTYGIKVGKANRDQYFQKSWTEIAVEMDGLFYLFHLTDGFWNDCPEFRDRGGVITDWLVRHFGSLEWPKGEPWQVELMPISGSNGFRMRPVYQTSAGSA